jgi:hypothetical protein
MNDEQSTPLDAVLNCIGVVARLEELFARDHAVLLPNDFPR